MASWHSYLTHLECGYCGTAQEADALITTCPIEGRPLLARYDLGAARADLDRDALTSREASLWRYRELLPVRDAANVVTLGEGMTPVLELRELAGSVGVGRLRAKDEGLNPTGSFKARGMAVAVSRALELGATSLVAPTAGNAGVALAAYAARAGAPATIAIPEGGPAAPAERARAYGAEVVTAGASIAEAGAYLRDHAPAGSFDLSTLREPYRVEGKKTMAYELAEQLGWQDLPSVIAYPTGGGTGIVGMWKAFAEMRELGWLHGSLPRFLMVQAEGCAPMVRAFEAGERHATEWPNPTTIAAGLRVPKAIGDFLILDAVRQSGGGAVIVTDAQILDARRRLNAAGLDPSNEAAATYVGLEMARGSGLIAADDDVLLLLTGAGSTDRD